jgi:hypothetical protein
LGITGPPKSSINKLKVVTSTCYKVLSKCESKRMDERKMGEMRRVRRKLGRVKVVIELVRNEGERELIYTWKDKVTPLG